MRKWIVVAVLFALTAAAPAGACETCAQYFDYQALTACKYCVFSYCGYYACVVRNDPAYGFQYCDAAWDVDGADDCFTSEGVDTNRCGPDQQTRMREAITGREWRLVRTRIVQPEPSSLPKG
jgi:hypothetical protein